MIWRVLAMTLAVLAATPVGAAELPKTGQAEVFYSIDAEQVAAVLKRGGFKTKIVKAKPEEGDKPSWMIEAQSKDPFYMSAEVRACDADGYPKGCLGIRFFASRIVETKDVAAARRAADHYNREYYIGKAYLSENGKSLYFENYLMIEGGVTADNLKENLDNFLAGYGLLMEAYEEQQKGVEA